MIYKTTVHKNTRKDAMNIYTTNQTQYGQWKMYLELTRKV